MVWGMDSKYKKNQRAHDVKRRRVNADAKLALNARWAYVEYSLKQLSLILV